jgi:MoaA/NifB/PqqE/SkfB family radical SAM enzyme
MNLTILYRGPLASCDYDCAYCPFAKRRDTPGQLRGDAAALARFTDWVAASTSDRISVLFTPWGEGLVRRWYRDALVTLSRLPNVDRVAIQTNLSCRLDWVESCQKAVLALWATFHPTQVRRDRFTAKCRELYHRGVRFSAGIVGLPEHFEQAVKLRAELPAGVYLWVNAAEGYRYAEPEIAAWEAIDPLFRLSVEPHASGGQPCRAGHTVISVTGDGTVRRCHFIPEPLGNLYDGSFRRALRPRPCTNQICDCHIGYVHLEPLGLDRTFAGGVLERIPADPVWGVPRAARQP